MRGARSGQKKFLLCLTVITIALILPLARDAAAVSHADSLFAVALKNLGAGNEREALDLLDRVLELSPGFGAARAERGRLFLRLGKLDEAQEDLNSASFDSSAAVRVSARIGLGDLYRRYGFRGLEAARQYRLALNQNPASREALYGLAETGFEIGDSQGWRMAARALADLLCVDPEYRDVYSLWHEKIKDQSEEELRRVNACLELYLQEHQEHAVWWLDIARDRFRLGDNAAARAALENHARLAPGDRPAANSLLSARLGLERGDSAGFEREYALALDRAARDNDFLDLFQTAEPVFSPAESEEWKTLETAESKAAFFRAFWLRRDPDPFDSVNNRLAEHFTRLRQAENQYRLANPHSRFNTSRDYQRLISPMSMLYEYDPDLFWDRSRALVLDQRGLLLLRHGPPDMVRRELSWENPQEIWFYGPVHFVFEKKKGAGDFIYIPSVGSGVGDIRKAMEGESYRDPLPDFAQDYYVVDFLAPDGRVELDFYQSAPAALCGPDSIPEAAAAVYDSTWRELGRDRNASLRIVQPTDSLWVGMGQVSADPGEYFYAVRFGFPGRRSVDRGTLKINSYSKDRFELSSLVLGTVPEQGGGLLTRRGVELLPRPSLRFSRGEIIHIFMEVYHLAGAPGKEPSFREWVTVSRVEKEEGKGWWASLGRLFGSGGQAPA